LEDFFKGGVTTTKDTKCMKKVEKAGGMRESMTVAEFTAGCNGCVG
jgi:hypothetical protein